MKLAMFNLDGRFIGHDDVPDEIIEASAKVEHYMRANGVERLYGLRLTDRKGGEK